MTDSIGKRILCAALAIISLLLAAFGPWITIKSEYWKDLKKLMRSEDISFSDIYDQIDDSIEDIADDLSDWFELKKSDVRSVKKFIKQVISILEDGKISAFDELKAFIELAPLRKVLKSIDIDELLEYTYIDDDLLESLDDLKGYSTAFMILPIYLLILFIIAVICIICRFRRNSKVTDWMMFVGQITFVILGLIICGKINSATQAVSFFIDGPLFAVGFLPFLSVVFALPPSLFMRKRTYSEQVNEDVYVERTASDTDSVFQRTDPVVNVVNKAGTDAAEWDCPVCGKTNMAHNRFCTKCGAKRPEKRKCPFCGTLLKDTDIFCGKCGTNIAGYKAEAEQITAPQTVPESSKLYEEAPSLPEEPTVPDEPMIQEEPTIPCEPPVPDEPTVPYEPTVPEGPSVQETAEAGFESVPQLNRRPLFCSRCGYRLNENDVFCECCGMRVR